MKKIKRGMEALDFTFVTPWKEQQKLSDYLINKKYTILIFMRFWGCRICQIDIDQIIKHYNYFSNYDAQVLIVLQTEPDIIKKYKKETELPLTIVCDPEHTLYKLYDVGTYNYDVRPSPVTKKLNIAINKGYKKLENNHKEIAKQLPATFIINKDKCIIFSHYGNNTGDIPDINKLLEIINYNNN